MKSTIRSFLVVFLIVVGCGKNDGTSQTSMDAGIDQSGDLSADSAATGDAGTPSDTGPDMAHATTDATFSY